MDTTVSSTVPETTSGDDLVHKRQLVADLCRFLGSQLNESGQPAQKALPSEHLSEAARAAAELSPRVRQTLAGLLAGDGEKQIARQLGISPHTIHVYVKTLYRHFDVCTRGELLARFVAR